MKKILTAEHEELIKLIQENPQLSIIPLVDTEVCGDDEYNCWVGSWGKCFIDEYLVGEERIYIKSQDYDDMIEEHIEIELEHSWNVHHPNYDGKTRTDEELELIAKEIIDNKEWIKCIVVNIETLD